MRDIVWMANGSASATRAAYRAGAIIGFEALNTRPPSDIDVEFVDFPFTKADAIDEVYIEYVETVCQEQPKMAVIPDLNEKYDTEVAFELATEPYCDTMIVAPKSVHPSSIPNNIRVGIPCQDKFSECPWNPDAFRECEELHLFGGSPHKHYEMVFDEGLWNVESMDTSVPLSSARWGDAWTVQNGDPYWTDEQGGVYGCIESTFRAMCVEFNSDRDSTPSKRLFVERPDYGRYETCGYPDQTLIHPSENMPFAGREYYTQMPYNKW
jgi:hypothetical protein